MSSILINITTSTREFKYYRFVILLEIFEDCFLIRTRIKILCNIDNRNLSLVYSRNVDRRDNNSISKFSINNISFIDAQFFLVISLNLYYIARSSTQSKILRIEYRCKTLETILLEIENFSCARDSRESTKFKFLKIMSNVIFLENKKSEKLNVDNKRTIVVNIKVFSNAIVSYSILAICLLLIRNNIQQLSSLRN